jgi:hypothetical protein
MVSNIELVFVFVFVVDLRIQSCLRLRRRPPNPELPSSSSSTSESRVGFVFYEFFVDFLFRAVPLSEFKTPGEEPLLLLDNPVSKFVVFFVFLTIARKGVIVK